MEVACDVCGYRLRVAGLRLTDLAVRPDDLAVLTIISPCPECGHRIVVTQITGDDYYLALGVAADIYLRRPAA